MAIALDPRSDFSYVLESDRELPEEERTTWQLRPLTIAQKAKIDDGAMGLDSETEGLQMRRGSTELEILRKGLIGCENLRDKRGEVLEFERIKGSPRHVSDEFLERLPDDWRTELANAITNRGEVSEAEGK